MTTVVGSITGRAPPKLEAMKPKPTKNTNNTVLVILDVHVAQDAAGVESQICELWRTVDAYVATCRSAVRVACWVTQGPAMAFVTRAGQAMDFRREQMNRLRGAKDVDALACSLAAHCYACSRHAPVIRTVIVTDGGACRYASTPPTVQAALRRLRASPCYVYILDESGQEARPLFEHVPQGWDAVA